MHIADHPAQMRFTMYIELCQGGSSRVIARLEEGIPLTAAVAVLNALWYAMAPTGRDFIDMVLVEENTNLIVARVDYTTNEC